MTTGDLKKDMRVPVVDNNGATVYRGTTFKRMWSGADSVPRIYTRIRCKSRKTTLLDPKTGKPMVIPEYSRYNVDKTTRKGRSENAYSVYLMYASNARYQWKLFPTDRWRDAYVGNYQASPSYSGSWTNPPAGPNGSTWGSNDDLMLINRLRAKMVGSEFDPALFLCQVDQTLGMIASAATRVDRFYRFLRKGQVNAAARALTKGTATPTRRHRDIKMPTPRDLASAQLELSYGWLPLLSDAYESAQYTASTLNRPQVLTYKARYKRRYQVSLAYNQYVQYKSTDSYVAGQIIARMTDGFTFSNLYLTGLDDPLGMAWERLPWSFVADWFIPIQTYLQDRAFARQVKGTFIKTTSQNVRISGLTAIGDPRISRVENPGELQERYINMTRSISTTLSVPFPRPKSLLSVPSWRRALNSVSLLVQRHGS